MYQPREWREYWKLYVCNATTTNLVPIRCFHFISSEGNPNGNRTFEEWWQQQQHKSSIGKLNEEVPGERVRETYIELVDFCWVFCTNCGCSNILAVFFPCKINHKRLSQKEILNNFAELLHNKTPSNSISLPDRVACLPNILFNKAIFDHN